MAKRTELTESVERLPSAPWAKTWLVAVVLFVGAGLCLEFFWRAQGHKPSTVDGAALWAVERRSVSNDQPQTLALLGTSRMQVGFDTHAARQLLPGYQVVQLAIDGRNPVATLKSLAEDVHFKGVCVCETAEAGFRKQYWNDQAEHVKAYERLNVLNVPEIRMKGYLQSKWVVLQPKLQGKAVLQQLFSARKLPDPWYVTTYADRARSADYSMVDAAALKKRRLQNAKRTRDSVHVPTPKEWGADVQYVDAYVQAIQSRGGRVVFVRFPHPTLENTLYPKEQYWDTLPRLTQAETLHFLDVPALTHFDTPDGSHLDAKDRQRFTTLLVEELHSRGIFSGMHASK